MTDASPRIFRNLEKSAARSDFDDIVSAAVATYGALDHPSETQARDLGRLVLPIFDKVRVETRRSLCAALSATPRLPRPLVERLLAEPVEVAAPFLMASPLLTPADLEALAARGDRRLDRVLARRGSSSAVRAPEQQAEDVSHREPAPPLEARTSAADPTSIPVERQATPPAGDAFVSTKAPASASGDRNAAPAEEAAPSARPRMPPVSRPVPSSAAEVREMLRQLATSGRVAPPPTPAELVTIAIEQDAGRFYAALARTLPLDRRALALLAEEPTGERLAVALRALGLSAGDVLSVLMMVKPALANDIAAFEEAARFVRALRVEDCASLVQPAAGSKVAATLAPVFADLESLARAEPRPAFGRRGMAPAEQKRFGRDAG